MHNIHVHVHIKYIYTVTYTYMHQRQYIFYSHKIHHTKKINGFLVLIQYIICSHTSLPGGAGLPVQYPHHMIPQWNRKGHQKTVQTNTLLTNNLHVHLSNFGHYKCEKWNWKEKFSKLIRTMVGTNITMH